jgi:hypothetical protein
MQVSSPLLIGYPPATSPAQQAVEGAAERRQAGFAEQAEAQALNIARTEEEQSSPDEQQELRQLQERDREVRAHEMAHIAAGAGLVRSGASFTYQRGADGRFYATGGEVSIDIAPVAGDPDATLRKAEQIQRAALAPAQPSGQDRSVAAQAAQMAMQARLEQALAMAEEDGAAAGENEAPALSLYA